MNKQRKITGEFMKRSRLYRLQSNERVRNERTYRRNSLLAAAILGFFFAIFISSLYKLPKITSPATLKQEIEVKAVEVTPNEDYYKAEPLRYIRFRGQQLGIDDYTISKFIRVAKCESGLRSEAKNPNSTAKGIYQIIIGTWDSNKCMGERWDFIDNIDCAYKLLQTRGFQPWISSKSCWNK